MSEFSFYIGGIKSTKPTGTYTVKQAIDLIRSEKYRATVEHIRKMQNDSVKRVLKAGLDSFTFSGVFEPKRAVDCLKKHSGLMTVDFDHLPDVDAVRAEIYADEYTHAGFISPSGEGLKLLVKIDPEQHEESFKALQAYYLSKYNLEADASGKDVSRVCFVSWDPDAFMNEGSSEFRVDNSEQVTVKSEQLPVTTADAVATQPLARGDNDASDKERHVAAVVQRVLDAKKDITGDYSGEWLLIGMSLSTLGEAGRQYYHALSRFNAAYTEKDTDEKFDNLLKTSRFKTPAKFFSICKGYGIDVSKPKRVPSDEYRVASNEGSDEDSEKGSDYFYPVKYYEYPERRIVIKSGRTMAQVADNFWILIKYMTRDEQENITWVLEVLQDDTDPIYIELEHEDFCSASKLKKALAAESMSLKITDSQLSELHGYLFTKTKYSKAVKVVRYGFHAESEAYFFSNVVLHADGSYTPDAFGIVEIGNKHLSMPTAKNNKKNRYELTDQKMSFNEFWLYYATAHGYENAFLPICFYIFSLFRDVALKEKNFSPILFLKGGAGTGKSSMVRVLTSMFGRKQQGVNLKAKNTESALVKIMSQASNQICWFDEFHNEFQHEGLLQAAYDNDGYHRSSDSSSIETNAIEIFSALALTSNYLPDNPIFFSRCLFVPIPNNAKSDAQRAAFYELENKQELGLAAITAELLPYRKLITADDAYGKAYKELYSEFRKLLGKENMPERLYANMSQVLAAPYILQQQELIQLTEVVTDQKAAILEEFIRIGELYIRRQHRIMAESKAVAEFFEIIQTLYESYIVHPELHFKLRNDTGMVMLNFPKLYNLFAPKYRQVFMKTPPDRDTIQSEIATLAGETDWESLTKAIRFSNDFEGGSLKKSMPIKGCCEVTYDVLKTAFGVDFETRLSRNE